MTLTSAASETGEKRPSRRKGARSEPKLHLAETDAEGFKNMEQMD